MPASALDSSVFRDLFGTEAMRAVFADEARVQFYLDIEAALARVEARLGIIPAAAAEEICRHCRAEEIDMALLKRQTERIGYPVLPVVQQLVAHVQGRARRVVPLGRHHAGHHRHRDGAANPRGARPRRRGPCRDLGFACGARAHATATRRWPGAATCSRPCRSPSATRWPRSSPDSTATARGCASCGPRVLVGEFGGAAGTLSSLGKRGLEVQAGLMAELRLGQPEIAWHTMRDRIAEVGCFLGLVTGTLGKIATDVKLLMQTEVEEVYEPFAEGRGSSSTMPQKRNPISSQLHHRLRRDGAPARGGAARRDGRGPRARDRPVGDRMDRAARDFPALGRRAGARARLWSPGSRSTRSACAQISI